LPATFTISNGGTTKTITISSSPTGVVTADMLADAISGAGGDWSVTSDGTTVTITDNKTGDSSTLTIAGPAASAFFPTTTAKGKGFDLFDQQEIDNERALQISFSSLPEDARNQLRPLYQAAGDWLAVADKTVSCIGDIAQIFTGLVSPPSMLGLIAKDGITLGTTAPLYGTGGGITFVATGTPAAPGSKANDPTGPDERKFIPVIEKLVQLALDSDDPLTEAAGTKFTDDSDLRKKEMPGHFRVAAQANIVMTAAANIFQVSVHETKLLSQTGTEIASKQNLTLRSYTSQVGVYGASLDVGKLADDGKQKAMLAVTVSSKNDISLQTEKLRAQLRADATNGDHISIGQNDTANVAVLFTKPHLHVNAKDGDEWVKAGYDGGGADSFFGMTVNGQGVLNLLGNTTAKLGVKNGAGVELSSDAVTIRKDLKVGSALIVRGDGQFSPGAARSIQIANSYISSHRSQHTTLISQARTQKASFDRAERQIENARRTNAPQPILAGFTQQRQAALTALAQLYAQHRDMKNDAHSLSVTPDQIGCVAADDELFPQAARDAAPPPPAPTY
jgi:hypothetical protein